jgi:hypothetical protein
MKRRTFVLYGAALASASASAWAAWEFVDASDVDTFAMVVRRRLDYLKLEPEGVRRFAQDMVALHVISTTRMHVLSEFKSVYARFPLSAGDNMLAYKLRHGEDRIVSSYLISSDFFINGADESRLVKYLGILDPRRACCNPFARRPYDL